MVRFKGVKLDRTGRPTAWDLVHDRYKVDRSRPARLGRHAPTSNPPPSDLLSKLSETERGQVIAWWSETVAAHTEMARYRSTDSQTAAIRRLIEGLARGTVAKAEGPDLWQLTDDLTAALRAAGMQRPKKAVVVAPVAPLTPTPIEDYLSAFETR